MTASESLRFSVLLVGSFSSSSSSFTHPSPPRLTLLSCLISRVHGAVQSRRVGAVVRTEAALITGAEDGRMRLWDLRAAPVRCALEVPKAHSNR